MIRSFVLLLVTLFTFFAHEVRADSPVQGEAVDVVDNWQYRWGDSPKNAAGQLAWALEPLGAKEWKSFSFPGIPQGRNGSSVLWERFRLPRTVMADPALYVQGVDQVFEVYLDGKLIYKFGKLNSKGKVKFAGYPFHFIRLPNDSAGKVVSFRIFSNHVNIGIFGKVRLGALGTHQFYIMKSDIDRFILGFIFIAISILPCLVFIRRKEERSFFTFSALCFSMGVYTLTRTEMKYFFFDAPVTLFWVELIACYGASVCTLAFLEQIFGGGLFGRLNRWAWKIMLIYSILSLLFAAVGAISPLQTLLPYQIMFLLFSPFCLVVPLRAALKKNVEGILFTVGAGIFLLAGTYDILVALGFFVRKTLVITHWGVTSFILVLAAIPVRRFVAVNLRIERLKDSLEDVLTGTKELAAARSVLHATQKATQYILSAIQVEDHTNVGIYLFQKDDKVERTMFTFVVQNGRFCQQNFKEIDVGTLIEGINILSSKKTFLTAERVVFIPIKRGSRNVGFMSITDYQKDDLNPEEAHFLDLLASSLAIALENISFISEMKQRAHLDAEVEAAKMVQESLLPGKINFPGLEVASTYESAAHTGGDWFGYFYDAARHRINFYIGDVTGHGIPSALLTGVACGAVYSSEQMAAKSDPAHALPFDDHFVSIAKVVNQIILQTGREEMLMTMGFMSLDLETGEVLFLNAGHNPPFWRQSEKGMVNGVPNSGSRLGFTADPDFNLKHFKMSPGDVIFMYTDGLIENAGPKGQILKSRKLKDLIAKGGSSVSGIQDAVLSEARGIWQNTPPADDMTILTFCWKGAVTREEVATFLTEEKATLLSKKGISSFAKEKKTA
jgi:serine phosphatase RsbU (regulator of sigma subunit)